MDALIAFLLLAGLVWLIGSTHARRLLPKYQKYALWLLLAAFFIVILPLRGNWNALEKLFLVTGILVLMGHVYGFESRVFSLRTVQRVVVVYGIWTFFCLFRPETGRALNRLVPADLYTAGLIYRATMSDAEKLALQCGDPARADLPCAESVGEYVEVTDRMRRVVLPRQTSAALPAAAR